MNKTFNLLKNISLALSIIAIAISALSYLEARKSNQIAADALFTTKSNFQVESRPYLSVFPERFTQNNKFIRIETSTDSFRVFFNFKLQNNGKLPAKDIHAPNNVALIGRPGQSDKLESFSYDSGASNDLSPGDYIYAVVSLEFGGITNKDVIENVRRFNNDELSYPSIVPFWYKSNASDSPQYKTIFEGTINPSDMSISKVTMD